MNPFTYLEDFCFWRQEAPNSLLCCRLSS